MNSPVPSLEPLLKTALLGTGREGASLSLEGALQPFGDAFNGKEAALLGAAAAVSICVRGGTLPSRSETAEVTECPPETSPYFSQQGVNLMETCLLTRRDLVPQAMELAAGSGRIAPPSLLVPLLETGRRSKEVRKYLLPLLGERGRWLAQLNPDWVTVAAPIDTDLEKSWQEGELAARAEALALQRELDAGVAREWVEAALKTEGAKERAQWLQALGAGLSEADEPLLEKALDDKSKEVRGVAVSLLEKLPDSRLMERAKQYADGMLSWNGPGGWLKRKTAVEIHLPEEWQKAWERDGLDEKNNYMPGKNIGQKASWMRQFLMRVSPAYWEEKWKATPAQLIEAVPEEWRAVVLGSWWRAAVLHSNLPWLLALQEASGTKGADNYAQLYGLPPRLLDVLLLEIWKRVPLNIETHNSLSHALLSHQEPWSVELGQRFLQEVSAGLKEWEKSQINQVPVRMGWLRGLLPSFADRFPVELTEAATRCWPQSEFVQEYWAQDISQFLARLQFRADLYREFSKTTP